MPGEKLLESRNHQRVWHGCMFEEHKKLHLGKCPRQCATSKMRAHNFRLWVCGFGMKLTVSFFKNCIIPPWHDFEVDDMPEEYLEDSVVDIGWQVKP